MDTPVIPEVELTKTANGLTVQVQNVTYSYGTPGIK